MSTQTHPSADVSTEAIIGPNSQIWHQVHIRRGADIGENCIIGKGAYIDIDVQIGNNVKIQNYVSIYNGVTIEDGVFVGPHVCFTNDKYPRAINPDGSLKSKEDWSIRKTVVGYGASLGANSTILPGVIIGSWAFVGAGSVVTDDIPNHGLAWGNPARLYGYVCACGQRLNSGGRSDLMIAKCRSCGFQTEITVELSTDGL